MSKCLSDAPPFWKSPPKQVFWLLILGVWEPWLERFFLSQSKQTYPVYALVTRGPSAIDVNISAELTPKPTLELGVPKHLSRILAYHLRQR